MRAYYNVVFRSLERSLAFAHVVAGLAHSTLAATMLNKTESARLCVRVVCAGMRCVLGVSVQWQPRLGERCRCSNDSTNDVFDVLIKYATLRSV